MHALMIPTSGWLWLALITTALSGACVAQRSEAISATAEAPAAPNLTMPAAPSATPTPEPIVLAAGTETRPLMPGTPQETPLYIIGSGRPGPVVLVLGGVHGDEPGGWLAADRVADLPFERGSLLVVPRANRQATYLGVRTTTALGDLNRLYPGDANGLPMARMAHEIVGLVREFRADVVLDLHESWGFYSGRTVSSTAFLGQTVGAYPNAAGPEIALAVVEAVNRRTRAPWEELFYREFPPRSAVSPPGAGATPGQATTPAPQGGGVATAGSRSSLGLGLLFPNVAAILVEMGQQQSLERRIALHVQVVEETLRQMGMRE